LTQWFVLHLYVVTYNNRKKALSDALGQILWTDAYRYLSL